MGVFEPNSQVISGGRNLIRAENSPGNLSQQLLKLSTLLLVLTLNCNIFIFFPENLGFRTRFTIECKLAQACTLRPRDCRTLCPSRNRIYLVKQRSSSKGGGGGGGALLDVKKTVAWETISVGES